ncbi:MAG TPA: nitrogen fixation protein NifZ [Gallionella sp.]|nr:nitrogen fixation protein NifZ [Gallionella sp.]
MIEPRQVRFQWGQRVVAGIDLVNDGSYPECAENALLVPQGTVGEVVQIGRHTDSDTPVYIVEFSTADQGERVVGCLEEEICLA